MRRPPPEVLVFRRDAPAAAVAAMGQLAPTAGWLHLQPAFDDDDAEGAAVARSGRPGPFSGRGPAVPECTWVPGERTRKGVEHVALGIEHGAGVGAAEHLASVGLAVPQRWVVLQDNPRRGLVVAVPPADDHGEVLAWLLDAATALSRVVLPDRWRALVRRRR